MTSGSTAILCCRTTKKASAANCDCEVSGAGSSEYVNDPISCWRSTKHLDHCVELLAVLFRVVLGQQNHHQARQVDFAILQHFGGLVVDHLRVFGDDLFDHWIVLRDSAIIAFVVFEHCQCTNRRLFCATRIVFKVSNRIASDTGDFGVIGVVSFLSVAFGGRSKTAQQDCRGHQTSRCEPRTEFHVHPEIRFIAAEIRIMEVKYGADREVQYQKS